MRYILSLLLVGCLVLGCKPAAGDNQPHPIDPAKAKHVTGLLGGEKLGLVEDPAFKDLMLEHGLIYDSNKAGSIDMVTTASDKDTLWPSSQVAAEMYSRHGGKSKATEIIFHSPIVVYAWTDVADALVTAGYARNEGGVYFIIDLGKLLRASLEGKTWKETGLGQLWGKVRMSSTDPRRSNSGFMFAGLAANLLVGDVVTPQTVDQVLPDVKTLFAKQGFMENSSDTLFDNFLAQGIGKYPAIIGYENQLVEFVIEHQEQGARIKDQIKIMYPEPTVWASHPLIARTAAGVEFLEALKDPKLAELAWGRHGFRSAFAGFEATTNTFVLRGIPRTVSKVMPMPDATTMERIIAALGVE